MKMKISAFAAAAILLGMAATTNAQSLLLNFDQAGSTAADFLPSGITIGYGTWVPTLDQWGDPVAGTEHWELDLSGGSVPVIEPSSVGWGPAPSGAKALDARDGALLMVFEQPWSFSSFSVTLDNSTFGDLFGAGISFYGVNNELLFTAPVDFTIPGAIITVGELSGVKSVLLPGGAFYDNVTVVPEPGSVFLFLGATALLFRTVLRRRQIA